MPGTMEINSSETNGLSVFSAPLSIFGLPVDRQVIFSNHKQLYRKRIEARQRNLIIKVSFIDFFLSCDEKIIFLTTGYSPVSVLEQIVAGPAFLYFNRALFVFTNKRIFHIPTYFSHSYRHSLSQIPYSDCLKMSVKGRSLVIHYKNGDEEIFPYIGRLERKKIIALFRSISPDRQKNLKGQRQYICPRCARLLPTETACCPGCNLKFKNRHQATLRSILLPGGGYFYSRYRLAGVLVGLIEILIFDWFIFSYRLFAQGFGKGLPMMSLSLIILVILKVIAATHANLIVQQPIPECTSFERRKV